MLDRFTKILENLQEKYGDTIDEFLNLKNNDLKEKLGCSVIKRNKTNDDELNKNETVTILSRTEIEYKIDSFIDYWYLIHDKEGNIGYMYGAYLDIQE